MDQARLRLPAAEVGHGSVTVGRSKDVYAREEAIESASRNNRPNSNQLTLTLPIGGPSIVIPPNRRSQTPQSLSDTHIPLYQKDHEKFLLGVYDWKPLNFL